MGCVNSKLPGGGAPMTKLKSIKHDFRSHSMSNLTKNGISKEHAEILRSLHIDHHSQATDQQAESSALNIVERMNWQLSRSTAKTGEVLVSAEELSLIKNVLDKNVRKHHYTRRVNVLLRHRMGQEGVNAEVRDYFSSEYDASPRSKISTMPDAASHVIHAKKAAATMISKSSRRLQQGKGRESDLQMAEALSGWVDDSDSSSSSQRMRLSITTDGMKNLFPKASKSQVTDANTRLAQGFVRGMDSWDFDIHALNEAIAHPLKFVAYAVLEKHFGASSLFGFPAKHLERLLESVEARYNPLPYHSSLHAADVTQTMHYFLSGGQLGQKLSPLQTLSCVFAAATHDIGHPGTNNQFLAAVSHPLALRYNDKSPLENMHIATFFELVASEECDIFTQSELNRQEYFQVRELMVKMVLATDNNFHSEHLGALMAKLDVGGIDWDLPEDMAMILQTSMHAADVSNPTKSWLVYERWTALIMEEFYDQGEKEREQRLSIKPGGFAFLRRDAPVHDEDFQLSFIRYIVEPLYRAMAAVPGYELDECVAQMDANIARWTQRKAELERAERLPSLDEAAGVEAANMGGVESGEGAGEAAGEAGAAGAAAVGAGAVVGGDGGGEGGVSGSPARSNVRSSDAPPGLRSPRGKRSAKTSAPLASLSHEDPDSPRRQKQGRTLKRGPSVLRNLQELELETEKRKSKQKDMPVFQEESEAGYGSREMSKHEQGPQRGSI